MRVSLRVLVASTLLVIGSLPSCGGSNSGSSGNPLPNPPATPVNPCASASVEEPQENDTPSETALAKRAALRLQQSGDRRGYVLDSLWLNRARALREQPLAEAAPSNTQDVGEIAVLQDSGDLIEQPNTLDLAGKNLRFTPTGGGFSVASTSAGFRSTLGSRVTLQDDDSASFTLSFPFTYYGTARTQVFVNSDGNLTFESEDHASTERNVSRVLTGPPRVAPFFADLDPSTGSGRVYVQSGSDAFTVTWCTVRGFDVNQTVTTQVSLLADGTVEMHYDTGIGLKNAVVAVSPGRAGGFTPVDLSAGGSTTSTSAVGERFSDQLQLDLVAVANRFYQSHSDLYDQLVLWTDTSLVTDAFAFETTIANRIRGLGIDSYDESSSFGSAGRLSSIVMMDTIAKYPADPLQKFLGENTTVSLIGQETGHRWLAFLRFRDASGDTSDALLGRDQAHWSFFMDSDASVMEGNDIEDLGGGEFRTVKAVSRYSRLDQYAMGLVGESDVPPFFYVESPTNVQPSRDASDAPDVGVTFSGTKRTVLISDVVAVMGRRSPSSRDSPRVHRQAFVHVVASGKTLDQANVSKIDRFRRAWETFFASAVDKRARAETRLKPPS